MKIHVDEKVIGLSGKRQSQGLKTAVDSLVDELRVSLPIGVFEAQRMLSAALVSKPVVSMVRSVVELQLMEDVCNQCKREEGL